MGRQKEMKMRVKSLDPMGLGKTMAAIYGAISLLFIPFVVIMIIVGFAAGPNQKDFPFTGMVGAVIGLALIIILPLIYAFMGFVVGALMAVIYNLVSRWIGGIIMELVPANLQSVELPSEPPYPLVPPAPGGANV
jgi:hypothetical protein